MGFRDYIREPFLHIDRSLRLLRDILDATSSEDLESDSLSALVKIFSELKTAALQSGRRVSIKHTLEDYATYVRYPEQFANVGLQLMDWQSILNYLICLPVECSPTLSPGTTIGARWLCFTCYGQYTQPGRFPNLGHDSH